MAREFLSGFQVPSRAQRETDGMGLYGRHLRHQQWLFQRIKKALSLSAGFSRGRSSASGCCDSTAPLRASSAPCRRSFAYSARGLLACCVTYPKRGNGARSALAGQGGGGPEQNSIVRITSEVLLSQPICRPVGFAHYLLG
jgi:hypothetical protein